MAMTYTELLAREELQAKLKEQGYVRYSRLLGKFELNLTKDPATIGYMEPNKGRIVINATMPIEDASLVVRHEILHQHLIHEDRLLKHLAQQADLDYDKLTDLSLDELKNKLYSNRIFNYAGDYEISNLGYTDADKKRLQKISLTDLNGELKTVSGLITELDHPGWENLSLEEMYDKLVEESDKLNKELQDEMNSYEIINGYYVNPTEFVDENGKPVALE